jgi:hypothetical protein
LQKNNIMNKGSKDRKRQSIYVYPSKVSQMGKLVKSIRTNFKYTLRTKNLEYILRVRVFIILSLFFIVMQSFSQNTNYTYAIFRYEDPDSIVMRVVGIPGYNYAQINKPNCRVYIEDSAFVNKLINRLNKLTIDTNNTTYLQLDVAYQLICLKTGYGYDVFNSSAYGNSLYPQMELNGKPMILDRKLLKLLDEIVRIHKEYKKPQFFPKDEISKLYKNEFW